MILTALSDRPVEAKNDDLLANDRYAAALAKFVQNADTPLTVGIQGGWGTGKTSLLNLLAYHFRSSQRCLVVPVNAWEHSLFSSVNSSEVVLSLLQGLVDELRTSIEKSDHIPPERQDELLKKGGKLQNLTKKVGVAALGLSMLAGKAALKTVGIDAPDINNGEGNEDDTNKSSASRLVRLLRKELEEYILSLTSASNGSFSRVVFFIDDLDRVPPPIAVEILDTLKNIFDVSNSVFILAIDYDVVVKGLKSRFGERSSDNEREFRQYFDKIIQVPFLMPVSAYRENFDEYMQKMFEGLNFRCDGKEGLAEVAWRTTMGVPRSLKRIVNTMSLLHLIDEGSDAESKNNQTEDQQNRKNGLLFKLVCLQIGFPDIFKRIEELPEIQEWSVDKLAKKWALPIEKIDRGQLKEEFPEGWQQVTVLLTMGDKWLQMRRHDVIEILASLVKDLGEGEDDDIGALLSSLSVTSVGEGSQGSESVGVRHDAITQFCQQLHKQLIDSKLAPEDDVSVRYAKQIGGRSYSFPLDDELSMGEIRLQRLKPRKDGFWQISLAVQVKNDVHGRKGKPFKEHMQGIARGEAVAEVNYPAFSVLIAEPSPIPAANEKMESFLLTFEKLAKRVRNRAKEFGR